MYEGGMGGGVVLGGVTAVTSAIILPNTGGSQFVAIAATTGLVVGVATVLTTVARIVAKKAYKA